MCVATLWKQRQNHTNKYYLDKIESVLPFDGEFAATCFNHNTQKLPPREMNTRWFKLNWTHASSKLTQSDRLFEAEVIRGKAYKQ